MNVVAVAVLRIWVILISWGNNLGNWGNSLDSWVCWVTVWGCNLGNAWVAKGTWGYSDGDSLDCHEAGSENYELLNEAEIEKFSMVKMPI